MIHTQTTELAQTDRMMFIRACMVKRALQSGIQNIKMFYFDKVIIFHQYIYTDNKNIPFLFIIVLAFGFLNVLFAPFGKFWRETGAYRISPFQLEWSENVWIFQLYHYQSFCMTAPFMVASWSCFRTQSLSSSSKSSVIPPIN